jgi:hypothetical protein
MKKRVERKKQEEGPRYWLGWRTWRAELNELRGLMKRSDIGFRDRIDYANRIEDLEHIEWWTMFAGFAEEGTSEEEIFQDAHSVAWVTGDGDYIWRACTCGLMVRAKDLEAVVDGEGHQFFINVRRIIAGRPPSKEAEEDFNSAPGHVDWFDPNSLAFKEPDLIFQLDD